jgi:hypothetical protein
MAGLGVGGLGTWLVRADQRLGALVAVGATLAAITAATILWRAPDPE